MFLYWFFDTVLLHQNVESCQRCRRDKRCYVDLFSIKQSSKMKNKFGKVNIGLKITAMIFHFFSSFKQNNMLEVGGEGSHKFKI